MVFFYFYLLHPIYFLHFHFLYSLETFIFFYYLFCFSFIISTYLTYREKNDYFNDLSPQRPKMSSPQRPFFHQKVRNVQ